MKLIEVEELLRELASRTPPETLFSPRQRMRLRSLMAPDPKEKDLPEETQGRREPDDQEAGRSEV